MRLVAQQTHKPLRLTALLNFNKNSLNKLVLI
jgi:hypothetical protein